MYIKNYFRSCIKYEINSLWSGITNPELLSQSRFFSVYDKVDGKAARVINYLLNK